MFEEIENELHARFMAMSMAFDRIIGISKVVFFFVGLFLFIIIIRKHTSFP